MKKTLFITLTAALALVSCHKQPVDVKAEFLAIDARMDSLYPLAQSEEEADSLIQDYVDRSYALAINNVEQPFADTLFSQIFYMLTTEQKQAGFEAFGLDQLAAEDHPLHHAYAMFTAEQRTSVDLPYCNVSASDKDGNLYQLSDFVGKTDYVLIDFWASWCGPCRRLIPHLCEIDQQYGNADRLKIIGISCDKSRQQWLDAVEALRPTYLQLRELKADEQTGEEIIPEATDIYGVSAIPTTILIDREGIIVGRNLEPDEILEIIAQ